MWTENNYRRIFLDMHIDDWNEEFLSKVDPEKLVSMLKNAGAQMIVAKCRPHTGLAHFPTKYGRQHKGLKGRDYVAEMVKLCHDNGIAVKGYFSQIFDNYSYDHHPDWRFVDGEGYNSRELEKKHGWMPRYGLICPNNEDYRAFCRDAVTEIVSRYDLDSIFLDMPFFTDICYCGSCRKKYYEQTGRELPRKINFKEKESREFQAIREGWIAEFTEMMRDTVKGANPKVTIEQNLSCIMSPWKTATTDAVAETCDYAGGDLYGGYLEESHICKYYRNLSKTLPFVFICSRCDPNLQYHTTTKTIEEFVIHGMTALVHNGALSICDGINPEGTLCDEVYGNDGPVKAAFDITKPYEPLVSGDYLTNAAIWFNSNSKYDLDNPEDPMAPDTAKYLYNTKAAAGILRMENIPYNCLPSKCLSNIAEDVLIIPDMAYISDKDMDNIEKYVMNGGNIYISGNLGNKRLEKLLEVQIEGQTQQNVTYLNPTPVGMKYFEGFTRQSPLAVESKQWMFVVKGECEILATMTLPYTLTGKPEFAAIHSNPPGVHTELPAAIEKKVGKGRIIWVNAPIESARPYLSRKVFGKMIRSLCSELKFTSNAPDNVEIMTWIKDGKQYISAINQQEVMPIVPVSDVSVTLPFEIKGARLAVTGEALDVTVEDGRSTVKFPKIEMFCIAEI